MHLFPLDFFDFSNLTRVIWNMRDLTMDGACWHTGDDTFTYHKSYKLLNVSETSFWRGCSSWGEGEGMDKGLCRYNCNETEKFWTTGNSRRSANLKVTLILII